jgi:hypothetical protein
VTLLGGVRRSLRARRVSFVATPCRSSSCPSGSITAGVSTVLDQYAQAAPGADPHACVTDEDRLGGTRCSSHKGNSPVPYDGAMRMWLDEEKGSGDYQDLNWDLRTSALIPPDVLNVHKASGVRARLTPRYVEIEFAHISNTPARTPFYQVVCVAGRDETSWWVLACIGDAFDAFVNTYINANDPVRYAMLKGVQESWPLSNTRLMNGFNGVFTPPAIVSLEDPDLTRPRWFAAGVRGNIAIDSLDEVLDVRTLELADAVLGAAASTATEMTSRSMSAAKMGLRAGWRSVSNDTKAQAKWVLDNFSSVVSALGKFSG